MTTIDQLARGRDNNFNLLRMIAASAVLVSHSWPLALGRGTPEPLEFATGYKLGTTAVILFFAISGFFITKSFDRRASLADFAIARLFRIYPALIVVLLLTLLVLGPLFTALPLPAYVADYHTWTYVPHNLLLRHPQWTLPGVFEQNRGGPAINGSLWTLFYEVSCYGLVVLCGLAGLLRPMRFTIVLIAAVLPLWLVPQVETGGLLGAASILTLPFALGAAAYVYRRHIPVSFPLAAALVAAAVLSVGSPIYPFAHALALSYSALWFGLARLPGLRAYNRLGDYSYGMYIYAFPVQQMTVALAHPASPVALALISFVPTLVLAVASWSLIEAPALDRRHHVLDRWPLRFGRRAPAG